MTLGIMQPYIFPYIGYFQLIRAVDKFVVYDDVNFINKGWINRNRILVGGQAHQFTIPLKEASQNKLILEIEISKDQSWKKKLLKTLQQSYQKAPYFDSVYPVIEEIIQAPHTTIAQLTVSALERLCKLMQIDTEIVPTSTLFNNTHLKGPDRILDICKQVEADRYINAIGGMELYDKKRFQEEGIGLAFIKSKPISYQQLKNEHIPWLSIIDILMFNEQKELNGFLDHYELV
ncbi:WbqC family protein [Dyadobacter tibetensis]|uniref:WbqC family protein n=1 Tax=Dyadobacter tibetensis TaxID=1211851 RepID=UPI000471E688|nr:WbqC family protein [Dyadobacter tibetensis]